jgi:hypothetical protein
VNFALANKYIKKPQQQKKHTGFLEIFLWGLIFLGLLVRFINPIQFNPLDSLWSDPGRHWGNGLNLNTNFPFSAFDPPVFQYWLHFIQLITFKNKLAIGIYAGLLSVAAPITWYLFFTEVFRRKRIYALIGFCLVTYLPSWIGIYSYFMNETLLIPLLGMSFYSSSLFLRRKTLPTFCLMLFFWLLSAFTKFIAVPVGLIYIGFCIYKTRKKDVFLKIILTLLLFGSFSFLSGLRTWQVMRVWAPFGFSLPQKIMVHSGSIGARYEITHWSGGTYYWEMGNASYYVKPLEPFSQWMTEREGMFVFPIYTNQGAASWNLAMKVVRADFPTRLKMIGENIILFFFAHPWPERNTKNIWEALNLITRWIWAPLFVLNLGLNFYFLLTKKSLPFWVILHMGSWIVCILSIEVGEPRYHKPIEGLMIANCLWVIYELRKKNFQKFLDN